MIENLEDWLEGQTYDIQDLDPSVKPLAVMLGRTLIDMHYRVRNVDQKVDKQLQDLQQLTNEIENIPVLLRNGESDMLFRECTQRVDIMWSVGKWIFGGLSAGIMYLIGQFIIKLVGI